MKISGNTILITGGGSGIGLALARTFVRNKNTVLVCDVNKNNLARSKREIPEIHTYLCDVTRPADRNRLRNNIRKSFPNINVLVNNAAICQILDFTNDIPPAAIKREVMINYVAPVELIRMFLPLILQNSNAAIVNLLSRTSYAPEHTIAVYSGTKAALHSFTKSLRLQLKKKPVRIFEVFPPRTDTAMNRRWNIKKRSPDFVADGILKGMASGKKQIWVGLYKPYFFVSKLVKSVYWKIRNLFGG